MKYLIEYKNIDYIDEILKYGELDFQSQLLPVIIIRSKYTVEELMNYIGEYVTDIEDLGLSKGSIDA